MFLASVSHSLRSTFPARASEWALGIMLFNWGMVLMIDPGLFDDKPAFHGLDAIMSQPSWMRLCLAIGGVRLIVLAINGAWRRSPHMRACAAFVSCFFWFEITIGFAQTGLGTGVAVYPVLFFLDAFNAIRSMGEAGLSDAHHQRVAGNGTDA